MCLEGSDGFVTSTAAPIASGWSDKVGRVGLAPTGKTVPYHGIHIKICNNKETSWIRMIDECSGAVLHTTVFPLGTWSKVAPAAVREGLRRAFARGACPTACGSITAPPGDRRATSPPTCRSGCSGWVSRCTGTIRGVPRRTGWSSDRKGRRTAGVNRGRARHLEELQERLERMDRLDRESYPYRDRLSRMAFFPDLIHSGRAYDPAVWNRNCGSGRALPNTWPTAW